MGLTEEEFREWCYRNGGETYGRSDRSGIVFHFPDTEIPDRVGYIPTNGAFQVITEGLIFRTESVHQSADAWLDDNDRLHIDTGDSRITIDPR